MRCNNALLNCIQRNRHYLILFSGYSLLHFFQYIYIEPGMKEWLKFFKQCFILCIVTAPIVVSSNILLEAHKACWV